MYAKNIKKGGVDPKGYGVFALQDIEQNVGLDGWMDG